MPCEMFSAWEGQNLSWPVNNERGINGELEMREAFAIVHCIITGKTSHLEKAL